VAARGSRPLSEAADQRPVDVGSAADPVAAVLSAHRAGRPVALRTSGTRGAPRAVVRTTGSWWDSFPHVARLTGLDRHSRVWLPGPLPGPLTGPLTGTLTLFAATLARAWGARVVADPGSATHAHLTPSALERALDAGLLPPGGHVTVAGERLGVALQARAVEAGLQVGHYYGSAELSFVAWGTHQADLAPFPEVDVEVRGGELWARSPYLCQGYAGPPGPLRRDDLGFATVGDRGALVAGRVVVHGRGVDAVTTGASTVLVADVEGALRGALVGEVVALGVPHPTLGQLLVGVLTDPADLPRAREAARGLEPAQRPRRWLRAPRLPVTDGGKVDREALAAWAARGGAEALPPPAGPRQAATDGTVSR
jgi:long-chain acyl-CoA synthetase